MPTISVSHLKKYYQVYEKEPGVFNTFKSLFKRKYHKVKAVNDISFDISEGELVGFIGPNGAGKTTTLKCLSGLLYPNEGKISVLNDYPYRRGKEFLQKIALIMGQKNQLWWDLPAIDTFLLNKEIYELDDSDYKKTLNELVNLLDVSKSLNIPVRKLSLGQRMKMELIAGLIHKPQVLFLDEPTIGLDVVMQQKMREFIREYNRRYKATIILTSHYMEDVSQLCKRIIIIDQGKIIYDGLLENIVRNMAKYKKISVIFEEYVDPKKLEEIGKIQSFEFPKAVFNIDRKNANAAVAKILKDFPVADLNIEEPEIEEIIRQVFNRIR